MTADWFTLFANGGEAYRSATLLPSLTIAAPGPHPYHLTRRAGVTTATAFRFNWRSAGPSDGALTKAGLSRCFLG